jgi:sugar phosphate isomerase/epimerase
LADDFEGVVRRVAALGYDGVEPAGFPGTTPEAAADLFAELNLTVPGVHAGLPLGDDRQRVLDTMTALACSRLVVPYIPPASFRTLADVRRVCEQLNRANEVAHAHGLTLVYHNHWWEYHMLGGRRVYQVMLEHLAPSIEFELDVYWAQTGGADPLTVIDTLGDRLTLLHVKDGPAQTDAPMVAVGQGIMDWSAIIPAAQAADWLIVELDRCATDMFQAVAQSYRFLTAP